MLNEAREVIQQAEDIYFRIKIDNKWFKPLRHLMPIMAIHIGIGEFFLWAKKYGIFVLLLIFLSLIVFNFVAFDIEQRRTVINLCIYLPILFVVFDIPSNYAFDNVRLKEINAISKFIQSKGIERNYQLTHLSQVISIAKDRVNERNKKLKWLLALYVAVATFMLNQALNIGIKTDVIKAADFISEVLNTIIINLIILFLAYILISGYKKANDAIFKRIELAILELQKIDAQKADSKKNSAFKSRLRKSRPR